MRIRDRHIGPGHAPYLIAELGVNHDGSVVRAIDLARAAHAAGADAIKLQFFRTDLLMSRAAKLAAYQKVAGETDPVAMLRRLELSANGLARVLAAARSLGVHAIVTIFSVELVAEAEAAAAAHGGWDAYKTASPDIIHRPLLEALAATKRPLIVSTGASTMAEVTRAVEWLGDAQRETRLAFLQCVSSYPTPDHLAALDGIGALAAALPKVPIGYSDHTASEAMGALAVAAGACILEKHFTYDRSARGPDHAASLDAAGFACYVAHAREACARHGRVDSAAPRSPAAACKAVQPIERDVRTVSRQSIVSRGALPAGHVLTRHDLTFKRPGTGIPPYALDFVLGARLAFAVAPDVPLAWADIGHEPPREETT
ncbi:MAG: N-acetylneuraminate synthase family protein [Phycisphaeraceae bacterium]|nr:N-acetylneuraminate synthase family protein [Phycisphaeraceae bacterium]